MIKDNVSYKLILFTQYLHAWMPFKMARRYFAILGTTVSCNMFTSSKCPLSGFLTIVVPEKHNCFWISFIYNMPRLLENEQIKVLLQSSSLWRKRLWRR